MPFRERRAALEDQLRASGLAYGTGAQDPAVELNPEAAPGERAFAHFVAGLVRLCASAAASSHARWFVPGPPAQVGVRARRAQLLAVLAAAGGDAEAAARLFSDPTAIPNPLEKLAEKTAARLSRRYLAAGGPFAGLPLHNGLCAVEVRCCATIALASFQHARISPGAVVLTARTTLRWRTLLVELLAGLAPLRLAEAPEGLPHALTTRLEAAVLDNLDRLLQEIRETRELGELLAKAAGGGTLSREEKSKVRQQLIDLAKTIPALAIFAAPGGMLLLPILFKLLPFNLLPSSFVDPPPPPPALPEPRRKSGSSVELATGGEK